MLGFSPLLDNSGYQIYLWLGMDQASIMWSFLQEYNYFFKTKRSYLYLQVLQATLQALHCFAQLVYCLAGVSGQVAHSVLPVLLAPGALTPGLALRHFVGCRLAARQLGVELLDGSLLAHDRLLLLKDSFAELDDRVTQLILHRAAALNAVHRGSVPAAGLCARRDGVANEAATCGVLTSHRAPTDQVQKSNK